MGCSFPFLLIEYHTDISYQFLHSHKFHKNPQHTLLNTGQLLMNLCTSYISTIFECISIKKDPEPKLQISLNTYHLQYRCTNVHYFKLQSIYSIYDFFPTSDSFSTYHSAHSFNPSSNDIVSGYILFCCCTSR